VSGAPETITPAADGEQELVRECVLYGLLFRAAMVDGEAIRRVPLKLSYHWLLEELSRWAEKRHHQLRRKLRQQGCRLLTARKQGSVYVVQYRLRGYVREAVYAIEVLRAECEQRARLWIAEQQEVEKTT
jgi:hypothetical protein